MLLGLHPALSSVSPSLAGKEPGLRHSHHSSCYSTWPEILLIFTSVTLNIDFHIASISHRFSNASPGFHSSLPFNRGQFHGDIYSLALDVDQRGRSRGRIRSGEAGACWEAAGAARGSPGDVAELDGDALCHAPLGGEHAPVLLLVIHQLPLDPSVAPVNLIQPGHLNPRDKNLLAPAAPAAAAVANIQRRAAAAAPRRSSGHRSELI